MDEDAQLIGQTIAGRYEVTGLLGTGGMGAVYVAKQMPLGRQVALKVIRPGLITDSQAVERFKREATTVSQLLHPNIVTVYDFGQAERGLLFISMELLPGENLRQRLRRVGALPWQHVLGIVRDIAGGLSAAHAKGVIHRDLKPDNVMLIDAGRPDFVKLLDFGVAKLTEYKGTDGHLTNTGMLVGTPGYMAPEAVLKGITTDPRSDLYAVGVLMFEMLTGTTMFTAPTPVALVMRHATERPPRVGETNPNARVPLPVEELLLSLIAKEPDDRPPDAKTLVSKIEHLQRFGDDIPDDPWSSGAYRMIATTGSLGVARQAPAPEPSDMGELEASEPTQINQHNPLAIDHTDEDTAPSAPTEERLNSEPPTRTFAGAVANTPETGSTPRPQIPSGEHAGPEVAVLPASSPDTLDSMRQAGVGGGGKGGLIAALLGVFVVLGAAAAGAWWYLELRPRADLEEPPEIAQPNEATPPLEVEPPTPTGTEQPAEKSELERCEGGDAAACATAAAAASDATMKLALLKRACDHGSAGSCGAAADQSEGSEEKARLVKRACELGDEARCAAIAAAAAAEEQAEVEEPDPRRKRSRRTRARRRKTEDPPVEVVQPKPDPGGFVPDLILDEKKKPKPKPKPKPKGGHVPDLMLE